MEIIENNGLNNKMIYVYIRIHRNHGLNNKMLWRSCKTLLNGTGLSTFHNCNYVPCGIINSYLCNFSKDYKCLLSGWVVKNNCVILD